VYVIGVDLGSGKAPFRNAPVIVVYEIDGKTANVVYLWWGNGRDFSYVIEQIMRAIKLYSPLRVHIDATGTQRGFFSLIQKAATERGFTTPLIGYQVDQAKKSTMVYAINAMLLNRQLAIPATHGESIVGQLIAYPGPENDKKIDQDIVMAMSMAAPDVWSLISTNSANVDGLDEIESLFDKPKPSGLDGMPDWL
jgi:hypothetical protein